MSITKIALVSAAVVVGGFLIIKRLLTDNEVAEKRKKIVKTDVDEVNYDILISDVKKYIKIIWLLTKDKDVKFKY